jgi:hypothetical protein
MVVRTTESAPSARASSGVSVETALIAALSAAYFHRNNKGSTRTHPSISKRLWATAADDM